MNAIELNLWTLFSPLEGILHAHTSSCRLLRNDWDCHSSSRSIVLMGNSRSSFSSCYCYKAVGVYRDLGLLRSGWSFLSRRAVIGTAQHPFSQATQTAYKLHKIEQIHLAIIIMHVLPSTHVGLACNVGFKVVKAWFWWGASHFTAHLP